ncbi:treslin [Elysia marginata]|uniref:Treslin n=1 Tax=Elysia marginata TaxID=1093978 RepID=A0AAV4H4M2_9GAST|nr:treslin [Elysia marginata]
MSRKLLTSDEISGASLSLFGMVLRSDVFDELIQHSSQSFILTVQDYEAMTCFLQTLNASDTIGLLNVTLRNKISREIAVLQSQLNTHSLTFLNMDTLPGCQQLVCPVISTEETRRKSSHLDNSSWNQKQLEPAKSYTLHQVYRSHCMNSWHLPGSTNQMSSISATLQDRLNENDIFLRNEKDGLKKLKQFYAKERQPKELIQNDQPVLNTPLCATKKVSHSLSSGSEQGSKGRIKRNTSSILQRGRLMVDKARSASLLSAEDGSDNSLHKHGCKTPEKQSSSSTGFNELGLKCEGDLQSYLNNQYEQILKANFATELAVKAMVTVTSQYMASMDLSNPQKAAANFIREHLSLKPVELKEKFKAGLDANDAVAKKATECKLQVFLVMETESMLRDNSTYSETTTEKIVDILRALSFSSGATDLKLFLKDIVNSYSATLPRLLVDIYDELMLPLPLALKTFASPSGPSSVLTRSIDHNTSFSSAPGSSQPSSVLSDSASQQKRSSRFKQHPSFADYHQKRQILVEPLPKPHSKGKSAQGGKEKSKARSGSPKKKYRGECDKAKRNLFSEHRPKAKATKIRDRHSNSRRKRRHSLSATDKARTLVLGTPLHKQKPGWHIQQQEKRRLRDKVQSEVHTVAESPVKEIELEPGTRVEKPARYLLRQAFYSSKSQQSRNFAKALEQSQNTDGFPISEMSYEKYPSTSKRTHGTLASAVRGESPVLSPRSRLIKTFMSSPSPAPKFQGRLQATQAATPGRPPRRLAKKLDFSNLEASSSPRLRQPLVLDAQLIFDGENAIDFDIMKSPSKNTASNTYREPLKTPEKQIKPSRPDMWSSASCPPHSLSSAAEKTSFEPSSELNFRNTLFQNAKSHQVSPEKQQNRSPHAQRKSTRKVPMKQSPQIPNDCSFSSPEQASRIRSNLFSKSPKKFDSFSEVLEKQCLDRSISATSRSPRKIQERLEGRQTTQKVEEFSFNLVMKNTTEPRTPQKLSSSVTSSALCVQSTPSKVKFSDRYLISPPTGSGYPPSAEKSTPGKSILKGSPSMRKVKIPRRIQLQTLEDLPSKTSRELASTFGENVHKSLKAEASFGFDYRINSSNSVSPSQFKKETKDRESPGRHEHIAPSYIPEKSPLIETEDLATQAHKNTSFEALSSAQSALEGNISRTKPAAMQIRTPSPSAKKSNSIQNWARRKKCSPKQNSKPHAAILSPTSSSSSNASSNDGKSKAPLSSIMAKVNEIDDNDSSTSRGKRTTRKRGLFQVDENEDEIIESKRLKKISSHNKKVYSLPSNMDVNRIESKERHYRAESPELFDLEVDMGANNNLTTGHNDFKVSQSPFSLLTSSVSHNFSPTKRLTRQSSNLGGDDSLGFSNSVLSVTIPGPGSSNKVCEEASSQSELEKEALSCTPSKRMSPANTSKTSGKKQYSPALSTFGLASLIESPFVAVQSGSPNVYEMKKRSDRVNPKSRKHLDLS